MKKQRWNLVHEDEHLMVIDKPANLLSVPDRYDASIPNLYTSLSSYREKVFVTHRLDKQTSGLIVFSKTEECYKGMSEIFENRQVEKLYYCICHSTPIEEVGQIDLPLAKSRKKGVTVDQTGKEAITKYRVLESFDSYAYCEVKILTGRQHQIRVHFKTIGCPILCDDNYDAPPEFYLSSIKRKYRRQKDKEEQPLMSRVALHAHSLSFLHPITNEELELDSPLPKDMNAVLKQMRKNLSS